MDGESIYNPASGLRGITSKSYEPLDTDETPVADSAGKSTRQQCFALSLRTPHGHVSVLYGHFSGTPCMDVKESEIEIPAGGRVKLAKGWAEGEFTVLIKGKRLSKVFKEISEGKRQDVHPCRDGNDDKPFVESVAVEAAGEE